MSAERFRGVDLPRVADVARRALGDDVMILHTRVLREQGQSVVEVLAAEGRTVDRARARLTADPLPKTLRQKHGRPFVIALVGPTGAGKTTTAAKLAVREGTFGENQPGLLTIDTFRVGGMEQLATYAELAQVPFEVVYDVREVDGAMKRLAATCDVVIVDTPGRSPAAQELTEHWRTLLDALRPDEVHLVLPASLRPDLAVDLARGYRRTREHCGVTHLLLSKLDEVPRISGVTDLALSLEMPTRWVTDGQTVPTDLKVGVPRLLRGFGLAADAEADWLPA